MILIIYVDGLKIVQSKRESILRVSRIGVLKRAVLRGFYLDCFSYEYISKAKWL